MTITREAVQKVLADTVEVAGEAQDIAKTAIEQRNMFAAAFIHACDDEGTYFGLQPLYDMAKMVSTKEAEEFVGKVSTMERGY